MFTRPEKFQKFFDKFYLRVTLDVMAVIILADTPCPRCSTRERYLRTGLCVTCARRRARAYVAGLTPAQVKRRYRKQREWVESNPDRVLAWRQANRQYSVTPTRPRPPACECCGRNVFLENKRLAVDHDHVSGAFRGWLCNRCNMAIGLLGDDLASVEKAAAYLRRT
jgi:hypothetical protein